MIRRSHSKIVSAINKFVKKGKSFTYEVQNETIIVQCGSLKMSTKSEMYEIYELNFIKAVKQHVIKNQLYLPYLGTAIPEVVYFKYGGSLRDGDHFDKVVNIDISQAYWETMNKLGLLSERLYKQGLEPVVYGPDKVYQTRTVPGKPISGIRKHIRLAAVGSLAKKRKIYTYDGSNQGKRQKPVIIRSEQTEVLWDVICSEVGKCLVDVAQACGDAFIFFWVDGIYVKKSAVATVKKMFKQYGYDFKVNEIKSIDITKRNIFVNLATPETTMKDGIEQTKFRKPFPYRGGPLKKR